MSIKLPELTINKLDFIDRCRERFDSNDSATLKLPQIIVVGDQSSGKSTILEALSGIKLPKGLNTVTKRPIVVEMRKSVCERITIKCDDQKYENVENVEDKLTQVQGEDITSKPCFVEVLSPTVPPLTVIDLPGIVSQRLEHQKKTIVEDVRAVVNYYMKLENSLILCVIPANNDFNTINTIDLASKCDTNKTRTIGVLTKIDKVSNEEIDAIIKILKNQSKPISKGYYGLILPESILSLSRLEREKKEMELFKEKSKLYSECSQYLGMVNFTNKLVSELVSLIDEHLPSLEKSMISQLLETNKLLDSYDNIHSNKPMQRKYLIEVKDSVLTKIEDALVKGSEKLYKYQSCTKLIKDYQDEHDTFLYGQHKIFNDLLNKFSRLYKESFTIPNCKYSEKCLQDLANRCRTEHMPIFMSSDPFKELVGEHLLKFEGHSRSCLKSCYDLAHCFIEDLITNDSKNTFPELKEGFKKRCLEQLEKQNEVAWDHIKLIFKSERLCFTQKVLNTGKDDGGDNGTNERQISVPEMANNVAANKIQPGRVITGFAGGSGGKDGDNISLSKKEDQKNSQGKILKNASEEFIKNMYIRLADVIPSLIMLNLFQEFHEHLKESLNQYVTTEQVLDMFKLSDKAEKKVQELTVKRHNLESSMSELKDLLRRSINGT